MSFRTFVDTTGVEWQAFDVVPRALERRHYDRRADLAPVEPLAESLADSLVDRRDGDRRIAVGSATTFQKAIAGGWLCFECEGERRRLAPIPDDWMQCNARQLEMYCRSARVVRAAAAGGVRH